MLTLRGKRWIDTLALWINLAFWVPRRLYWRLRLGSWPAAIQKLSTYRKTYWFYWPIPLKDRLYRYKGLWVDIRGFLYLLRQDTQDFPSNWLQAMQHTKVGLDIGAFRGYWTLGYKSRLPAAAKVLLFEPNAENYANLVRNLYVNQAHFATPFCLALWEKKGLVDLVLPTSQGPKPASEASWIYDDYSTFQVTPKEGQILATTLDAFLQALPIEELTWIKIDTEGAEVAILRGASETLRRFRPTLWIEVHGTWTELRALLEEYGYAVKAQSGSEEKGRGHIWAEPL